MSMTEKKIKVLIIDDSAFIRHLLVNVFKQDSDIEVVGTANDPIIAKTLINQLNPDVLTLDIQMPNMNGLDFLERLMSHRPMPVIMISSLTEQGAEETIKALELGAIDYITKPTREIEKNFEKLSSTICHKIKIAAAAKIKVKDLSVKAKPFQIDDSSFQNIKVHNRFIALGASTGGVEALSTVINALPEKTPPILIAQHMPEKFTTSFAARLDRSSKLRVYEAQDGQILEPGCVYLAPGKYHLGVKKMGMSYATYLNDGLEVNGHKPSVDFLFDSMAKSMIGNQICAFLLTGMGKDGAYGLKKLKDLGAKTYGQDKASCVVYGMPRVAFEIGAVEKELNINEIATYIMQFCTK